MKKLNWLYIVSIMTYFLQGIESLPSLGLFLYLKESLRFTPEKIMYIGALTGMAWTIKPLWGFLCDNFLSNKKWILISLSGSTIISLIFGLNPFFAIPILILLLGMSNLNTAVRDVATDGMMCIEGKKENICDKIQSIQWISITVAAIIVGLCGGYIADHYSYKIGYISLIPLYLLFIGFIISNKESHATRETQLTQKPLALLLNYRALFTNKQFLLACLFLFLYKYSPSFGTPLLFIERDIFKWSGQFMGSLSAIISCFEILGALLFYKYCKIIPTKKFLYISVFLGAILSLCYLKFTPITAIIYGILFSIIGMFIHLIIMSWMAKSTLPGKEAVSFALLCSINNLSNSASTISGAILFPKIGLFWLIILSSATSFLCLPLLKKLEIK